VGPGELRQPKARNEGDCPLEVPGVAVLDDLFELTPQGRGKFHRLRRRGARGPNERPHRVGAGREPVVPLEAVEQRLLLGGQAYSEESSRRSVVSGVPHA